MSITRSNPNTIFLGGDKTIVNDLAASASITPGMLIERNLSGSVLRWRPATTDALATMTSLAVALDHSMANKGVDDAYAANDLVEAAVLHKGAAAWMLLASGQVVSAGAALGLNTSSPGTLKPSPTVALFTALETKSAPQSTATIRIRVEAL